MMTAHELRQAMLSIEDLTDIFHDLSPIPQHDGPDRVCVIQYPTGFAMAYNYMRAVWESEEMSDRALKLSATCAKLNPANYTVWHYRRQCFQSLGLSRDKEAVTRDLALAATLGGTNPKNYQIWYHRRALLETYGVREFCESELEYIEAVFEEDSKNYHAWSYRQWIIATMDDETIWAREANYAASLIESDARNNSAWNQRWFAVHRGTHNKVLNIDMARHEAEFAIQKGASLDPYNESPWRYLVGVLKEHLQNSVDVAGAKCLVSEFEAKANLLKDTLVEAKRNPDACKSLTAARIDLLELLADENTLHVAIDFANAMKTNYDVVRRKYWQWRMEQLERILTTVSS